MAAPNTLPVIDRTDLNSVEDFTFCNSPIHLRLQNTLTDVTIQKATVYLWIWNGAQNKTLAEANYTLVKSKVSASDDYINFQISDLIKSFLVSPDNAPNTNQPTFAYNELANASITGQGVFWQIIADIESEAGIERKNYTTAFSTLGYRWNYEQNIIANNGIDTNGSTGFLTTVNRWYNPKIHNYISQTFDLTTTVATATTANVILLSSVVPPDNWKRCSRDPYLIVYLNKLGLWDMFTPHGKVVVSGKIEGDNSARSYRDPSRIDNSYVHSRLRNSVDVMQSYAVNTGSLNEDMISLVEEIIYSPKVYLIKFKGDVQETSTIGVTIDNTFITIDSLHTTIDGLTVEEDYVNFFKTHQQIPVVVTDTDFVRKTRVNDRSEISYNIKFEETNNKINDIR